MGYNPSQVFEERAEELEQLKKLGITTDSDPANDKKAETKTEPEPAKPKEPEESDATDPDQETDD